MEETTVQCVSYISTDVEQVHTLSDEAIQVLVVGALNAEVPAADVVDGLVVNHEGAVGVLQGGVSCENGVVGLDNGSGDLRRRVDTELELALLAVVDGQTLHQEGTETGTCSTAEGVEDEETLQTGAVVGNAADLIQDLVDELLADCVVTTGVVVGRILLAGNHVLGVEERTVGTGADLVDDVGLQVGVDGTRDVLALACIVCQRGCAICSMRAAVPVSEKKVLKPWSSFLALRSSVR